MNTTPRVVTRGIATDIRASLGVRGTSSPRTSAPRWLGWSPRLFSLVVLAPIVHHRPHRHQQYHEYRAQLVRWLTYGLPSTRQPAGGAGTAPGAPAPYRRPTYVAEVGEAEGAVPCPDDAGGAPPGPPPSCTAVTA